MWEGFGPGAPHTPSTTTTYSLALLSRPGLSYQRRGARFSSEFNFTFIYFFLTVTLPKVKCNGRNGIFVSLNEVSEWCLVLIMIKLVCESLHADVVIVQEESHVFLSFHNRVTGTSVVKCHRSEEAGHESKD